jgi:hypothetical protein
VGDEVVVQALDGARGDADLFCDGLLGEGLREEAADLDAESGFLDLGFEGGGGSRRDSWGGSIDGGLGSGGCAGFWRRLCRWLPG